MNKEKEILESLKKILFTKRNEYADKMNEYCIGEYYNYCRGKKDLIEDIINFIEEKYKNE